MKQDKLKATARLLEIMDTLREQCPWDRKQTFETLRNNTIEETYELADAILNKDLDGIKEEAGDLLLHVVFYAKLGEEAGALCATSWSIAFLTFTGRCMPILRKRSKPTGRH